MEYLDLPAARLIQDDPFVNEKKKNWGKNKNPVKDFCWWDLDGVWWCLSGVCAVVDGSLDLSARATRFFI